MNAAEESALIARRRRLVFWIVGTLLVVGFGTVLLTTSVYMLAQREAARGERCDLNLARLYAATVEYCDANGSYPPPFTVDAQGRKLHSWRVLLLPYLGEEALYGQIRLDEPWNSEYNAQFWSKAPNVFQCASVPTDEGRAAPGVKRATKEERCAVSCVLGDSTPFPNDGRQVAPDDVSDGLANTILFVERKSPVNWMNPDVELTQEQILEENAKPVKERENFGSWHGAGEFVVFCDGARRFLSEKIDGSVLRLLLQIDDAEEDAARVDEEGAKTQEDARAK